MLVYSSGHSTDQTHEWPPGSRSVLFLCPPPHPHAATPSPSSILTHTKRKWISLWAAPPMATLRLLDIILFSHPGLERSGFVAIGSSMLCTLSLDGRGGGSVDGEVREGGHRGEVPAHAILRQWVVPGATLFRRGHPASPRVHHLPQRWRGASSSWPPRGGRCTDPTLQLLFVLFGHCNRGEEIRDRR